MEAGSPQVEIWRPNREKPESRRMKAVITLLLLASAGLALVITIGGWSKLEGGGGVALGYVAVYLLFAFLVTRWNRGVLPVASALAIILVIFAALAAPAWFERDKAGFESPLLDENMLGLLALILVPTQLLLIIASLVGFNQEWHVEEERPAGAPR